jgi:hypothetical protein
MELHAVAVPPRLRCGVNTYARDSYPVKVAKGAFENSFFGGELSDVGQVLKGAAAAEAEDGADRLHPQRGRLQYLYEFALGPTAAVFGYFHPDQFAPSAEVDKDAFPVDPAYTGSAGGDIFHLDGILFPSCHKYPHYIIIATIRNRE